MLRPIASFSRGRQVRNESELICSVDAFQDRYLLCALSGGGAAPLALCDAASQWSLGGQRRLGIRLIAGLPSLTRGPWPDPWLAQSRGRPCASFPACAASSSTWSWLPRCISCVATLKPPPHSSPPSLPICNRRTV